MRRIASVSIAITMVLAGVLPSARGDEPPPTPLEGWKWKGSELKAMPETSQGHVLWQKLCDLFDCMPADLLKDAAVKKEDVTVFNPHHGDADASWGTASSQQFVGGVSDIRFTTSALKHPNVYKAKFIVYEELFHSTQREPIYKKPDLGEGLPTQDQIDLALTNLPYFEVDAKLKAAGHVGPMTGESPWDDVLAQQQLDEHAKKTVEDALEAMCVTYDKIKDKGFGIGTDETCAQNTFADCKEAAEAFVK